jgi:hypothetical protein
MNRPWRVGSDRARLEQGRKTGEGRAKERSPGETHYERVQAGALAMTSQQLHPNAEPASVPGEIAEIFGRTAHPDTVFGQPIVQDGIAVLPVARARWGLGGGRRMSGGKPAEGGGGRLRIDPIGVVVLRGHRAKFQPIRSGRPRAAIGLALATGFLLARVLHARGRGT